MKQEEIIKGNDLIAKFMGLPKVEGYEHTYRINDGKPNWYSTEPKYNESWDWIMPVVEKIGKTIIPKEWLNAGWDLSIHYSIHSVGTSFEIGDHDRHISDSGVEAKMWDNVSKEPITRTWLAVIEFIKWYNEQKNK